MTRSIHRLQKEKFKYFKSLTPAERFLKAVELSELVQMLQKRHVKRNKKNRKTA